MLKFNNSYYHYYYFGVISAANSLKDSDLTKNHLCANISRQIS